MQRKVSLSQIKRLISSCLTEKLSNISSVLEPNLRRIRLCCTPFWSVKSIFTSQPALSELISLSASVGLLESGQQLQAGGLSGAVVPGDAVNVTERKAYRLLLVAKARKRDFFNAYFGYLFHEHTSVIPKVKRSVRLISLCRRVFRFCL